MLFGELSGDVRLGRLLAGVPSSEGRVEDMEMKPGRTVSVVQSRMPFDGVGRRSDTAAGSDAERQKKEGRSSARQTK